MGNDLYIGAPNGIMLCVDGVNSRGCQGCFWHAYSEEPTRFESFGEMLFQMERFFDRLDFPRRGNSVRNFTDIPAGRAGRIDPQRKSPRPGKYEKICIFSNIFTCNAV